MQFIKKGTGISKAEQRQAKLRQAITEGLNAPKPKAEQPRKPRAVKPNGEGLVPNKFGYLRKANRVEKVDAGHVRIIATGEVIKRGVWVSKLQKEAVERRRERGVCIKCGKARDTKQFVTCGLCRVRCLNANGEGYKLPLSKDILYRISKVSDKQGLTRGEWMKELVMQGLAKAEGIYDADIKQMRGTNASNN